MFNIVALESTDLYRYGSISKIECNDRNHISLYCCLKEIKQRLFY